MPSRKFAGEFINLAKISEFVADQAALVGLNERETYEVQLAVDEACSNIIEHAYGGEGRGEIEIICNIFEEGLEVILKDQGKSFDLDSLRDIEVGTPLEQLGNRGAGVYLMRKLMDEVNYDFSRNSGTVLKMKKSRSSRG